MSGGYGTGGYPGQGYDDDPGRARRRRGGGQQRDEGYDPAGYGGQEYGDPGYGPQGYDSQGYGRQGTGGYRYPPGAQPGPQPGQYGGTGGMPQHYDPPRYDPPRYDQRQGTGPRRRQGGYDQRGHHDWDADGGDSSFLPGFGGRDRGRYPQERDGGYDDYGYDDRRTPRPGRPGGRGPAGRAPGGRAPGDRGSGGRGPGGPRPDPRAWADAQDDYPEDHRPYPDDDWDDRNRKPRKKVTRWFPRILVLTVVAAIVAGGLVGGSYVYRKYEARYHPPDYAGPGTGNVTVQVKNGDTAFSLAPALVKLGVIASDRAFTNAAEAQPTTTGSLETGYYQLHYHMKASLAYAALLNSKNRVQTTVTIPEGKRVSQVLTILAKYTKIPLAQFQAAAKETSKLGLPSYAGADAAGKKLPSTVPYGGLEGYLFPATYAISPHETPLQILQAMVQRFNIEAQQINIVTAAKSVGLTPDQLITEASMVQAEAGVVSDMPKMARVIVNRKAKGMPYGFDSVVLYGLGKYGLNISPAQAAAAGPYNDTQKTGLPPTPIGNPGDAAIQAILKPANGPWLYFLTKAGGKQSTFSAHCLQGTC